MVLKDKFSIDGPDNYLTSEIIQKSPLKSGILKGSYKSKTYF